MKRDKETRVNVGTSQAMRNKYLKKTSNQRNFISMRTITYQLFLEFQVFFSLKINEFLISTTQITPNSQCTRGKKDDSIFFLV